MEQNLIEAIQSEMNRVREIIPHYAAIGPCGMFGKAMLESAVLKGEESIASGDTVAMVRALDALRSCEA